MPTVPQPNEEIESVIEKWFNDFMEDKVVLTKRMYEKHNGACFNSLKEIIRTHLLASYEAVIAAGRSSMRRDIEAVVPKEREIIEINLYRADDPSYEEGAEWNACRSQLLDNMKGIL